MYIRQISPLSPAQSVHRLSLKHFFDLRAEWLKISSAIAPGQLRKFAHLPYQPLHPGTAEVTDSLCMVLCIGELIPASWRPDRRIIQYYMCNIHLQDLISPLTIHCSLTSLMRLAPSPLHPSIYKTVTRNSWAELWFWWNFQIQRLSHGTFLTQDPHCASRTEPLPY